MPKIDFSNEVVLKRDVNLTIGSKTITGKVTVKDVIIEIDDYIHSVKVELKGLGIDINTTTISIRVLNIDGAVLGNIPDYLFDVYAGTSMGSKLPDIL